MSKPTPFPEKQAKMPLPSNETPDLIRDIDERRKLWWQERVAVIHHSPFSATNAGDSSSWPQGLCQTCAAASRIFWEVQSCGRWTWSSSPVNLTRAGATRPLAAQAIPKRKAVPKIKGNPNFHLGLRPSHNVNKHLTTVWREAQIHW